MAGIRRTLALIILGFSMSFGLDCAAEDMSDAFISSMQLSLETVRPTIVKLTASFKDGPSSGFGIVVARSKSTNDVLVLTAAHVVTRPDGPSEIPEISAEYYAESGPRPIVAGSLMSPYWAEPSLDYAFVKTVRPSGVPLLEWDAAPGQEGELITYIGIGHEWRWPRTPARIASLLGSAGGMEMEDAFVEPGTSGAPIFSKRGLAGLVVNVANPSRPLGVSIGVIAEAFQHSFSEDWIWLLKPSNRPRTGALIATRSDRLADEVSSTLFIQPLRGGAPIVLQSGRVILIPVGDYKVVASLSGESADFLTCEPSVVRILKDAQTSQSIACKYNLTGRWQSADGTSFVFEPNGEDSYLVAILDHGSKKIGSATALLQDETTLQLFATDSKWGTWSSRLSVKGTYAEGPLEAPQPFGFEPKMRFSLARQN